MAKIVFSGLVIAWRLAGCPTSTSPVPAKATTEGVVRAPSAFSMTLAWPPSMTATQEFVVPRSIPITFGMYCLRQLDPHHETGLFARRERSRCAGRAGYPAAVSDTFCSAEGWASLEAR